MVLEGYPGADMCDPIPGIIDPIIPGWGFIPGFMPGFMLGFMPGFIPGFMPGFILDTSILFMPGILGMFDILDIASISDIWLGWLI